MQLTNQSNGQTYQFNIEPGNGTLGNVPEGTYNVYIYNQYGYMVYSSFEFCYRYASGYEVPFYNVYLNSSGCSNIIINY